MKPETQEKLKRLWTSRTYYQNILPSIPGLYLFYRLINPVWQEIKIGNYYFLEDWYNNNTYYFGYITLFFTNKNVFMHLLPIALTIVFVVAATGYMVHRWIWARIFPTYVMVFGDKETEDRRVYWYTENIFTRIARSIDNKLGIKTEEKTTCTIWLNYGWFNPILPGMSMKKLIIPREALIERDAKYLRANDDGLWIKQDKYTYKATSTILDSQEIDNTLIEEWINEDFTELARATAEGSKADPHIRKKFLLDGGGFMIPSNTKTRLIQAREDFIQEKEGAPIIEP